MARQRTGGVPVGESYAALTWQHFVNDGLASYLPGILPALAAARGVPVFLLGSLATVQTFGQAFQPLAGIIADRIGGRAFVLLGPLLSAVAIVGMSVVRPYPLLAVCLFLTGIGSTLFHPQALSTARSLAAERQGVTMSLFLVGGEMGRALSPLAAGAIVAAAGISHLWLLAVVPVLALPWLMRAVPRLPRGATTVPRLELRSHLWPMLALLLFTGLRAGAISGLTVLMPLLWHARGGSLVAAASLVTTMIGIGIMGNLSGGLLADRIGGRPVLWGTSVLGTLFTLILTVLGGVWLWPVLGLVGMALFSSAPITMLAGQDIFPENRALGSGIALGAGNALGALLLLPVSYVADHASLTDGLFVVAGFLVISMATIPYLFPRPEGRGALAPEGEA